MADVRNRRILVIDDNESIHDDFRKILDANNPESRDLAAMESVLFGAEAQRHPFPEFHVDSAFQGEEGLEKLTRALQDSRPYALAFVDMRMPPGWDGLETIGSLWKADPTLQVVICTAYSDHSWEDMVEQLGDSDNLLILKKPFDVAEVRQIACALTEKWEAHRKVRSYLEELEGEVRSRTDELQRRNGELEKLTDDLFRAKQAAEQSDRAKSEFLANMSHEIRTPLTAILGYAELLREQGDDPLPPDEANEALEIIQSNGTHLLGLINDILDLSKIEAGHVAVDPVEVDLRAILEEVCASTRIRAREKGFDVVIEYRSETPTALRTDPTRFKQIVINLVGNAVKFTEKGGVEIIVSYNSDDGQSELRIDVVDTGIGLNNEQIEKLFRPFVQADSSTTRRYGGTGLGLSLSKRFANLLGGDIIVQSTPEVGSTFTLLLPVEASGVSGADEASSAAPPRREEPRTSRKDAEPERRGSLAGARVLLAEDVETNRRFMATVLERQGARVTVVSNGREALVEARKARESEHPFDVILLDLQMPVMDGFEATRQLRRWRHEEPIVALTANALKEDLERCLKKGFDDYATKPIQRCALVQLVERHLTAEKLEAEPTGAS